MRRPTTIVLIAGGLVLFALAALLLASDRQASVAEETGNPHTAKPGKTATDDPAGSTQEVEPADRPIRRIAPKVITVAPYQSRGLTREPALAPSSAAGPLDRDHARNRSAPIGMAASSPKAKPEDDFTRLFRPVASAAGRVEAGDRTITISGVRVVEPGQVCDASDGSTWPCGMRARTAFRAWLHGRAIACKLGNGGQGGQGAAHPDETGMAATRCRLGDDDIGRWLVQNGWAVALRGGPYAALGDDAEHARRGIFGSPPESLAPLP